MKNFIGWNPQKFSPVNLSLYTVLIAGGMIWTPYDWLNKFYSIIIMGLLACTWHTTLVLKLLEDKLTAGQSYP